jgi:hypothetical protein
MMENVIDNECCLLAHDDSGYVWCEPPSSKLSYGQESQGQHHEPHQKRKKCHGNRKLQRFRRNCRARGTEEEDDKMNVFPVSKSNGKVELPLSNHNQVE